MTTIRSSSICLLLHDSLVMTMYSQIMAKFGNFRKHKDHVVSEQKDEVASPRLNAGMMS